MDRFNLLRFDTADALAQAAASAWLGRIQAGKADDTPHYVAISGGRIARSFLRCTVDLAAEQEKPFANTHLFWADERCVPPDHEESNFKLADQCLLSHIHIPTRFVHRVPGEKHPQEAARIASDQMRSAVPLNEDGIPLLSLVILGMGEDGHVASLFPGGPVGYRSGEIYLAVSAPKPPSLRVTLGYSVICSAREVFVLVSGPGKEKALEQSLEAESVTPLGKVLRARECTTIWTDIPLKQAVESS